LTKLFNRSTSMTLTNHPVPATVRAITATVLCYLLLFLSCIPFSSVARSESSTKTAVTVKQEESLAAHRDGELLVRFRAGVPQQVKDTILASHRARRKKYLSGESGIEKLQLSSGRDLKLMAFQFLMDPQVEFAEPNFLISKDDLTPNDPQFDKQWALRNIGQEGGLFGSDIKATTAWETTIGSASTVVAVLDSGIDFTHPDLRNNRWTNPYPGPTGDLHGWDFVDDTGEIKDEHGHGTAIAGIIAAQGNNGVGVSGVMWRAGLMSLRVLDNTGTGDIATAVEAIDYATTHGAQVINLSWGTAGNSIALKAALERAIRRNVVVVCSAGNSSSDIDAAAYYPASFNLKNLISVAASDTSDRLVSWSNWGPNTVSVAAPGTNLLTTQRGGGYWNVTGTSAAAPIVSGIAGLLKAAKPQAPATVLVKAIADGARPTASLAGKVSSGGVVDATAALLKLHSSWQSPPFSAPGYGSGGTGPGGTFSTTPPPVTAGAPGTNLPNLDEARYTQAQQPNAKTPIQSNLPCADCDPQGGGGGGGYYPPSDPNFSTARIQPRNETGEAGVDLGSRNFNWSIPLLSLPGRAGLDFSLTLSYNSLVWTKDGSYMKFNADLGSPAPGFRLGLPILQQRFLNSQTGIYAYMLITQSGSRVELRQVGSSNIYESQDSSYTQLDVSNPNAPLVRSTDGPQYTFTPVNINSEYRCREIKDRNGNYISATYNTTNGHLLTITDTLQRLITFVYNGDGNLQAIRQTWATGTHDWATFNYGQVWVAPAFGSGLLVNGPNGNYTTVLTQVSLHDGSYFTFQYNAPFAQVNRINHYAPDAHLLNYTSYNVSSAGGQTDCPRFTERRDWAESWNNSNEALTSYAVAGDGSWAQQTTPNGTIYKEFFATLGWQTGLTTGTEVWSGGVKKKWTTIAWIQDNTGLSYQKNVRPYDTSIYDEAGNRRRTEISYSSFNLPNSTALPTEVKEYAADGTTLLRRKTITYIDAQPYIDRRVLGLVREVIVYDGNNVPQSKVWHDYDWFNDDYWVATPQPATQHDASGTAPGRGNLCWIGRWDVSDVNNFGKVSHSFIKYNRTGSVTKVEDHFGQGPTISYTDSFSDAVNRNTFAYPSTVTDADGFQALKKYNFDFGAVTWVQTPSPNVGQTAPTQTLAYDSAARLQQLTSGVNGAYVRWVYPANGTSVQSFRTIVAGAGEAYSIRTLDGAGRVRGIAMDHPGSTGLYRSQFFIYDNLGRLVQQSNPTEMNASWTTVGDDSVWVYSAQAYDWNNRPTLTTHPDGSTRENTYGGCGCAGGQVTTIRDERGRRRKLTMDVLGRLKQVEELNWDQSPYATTTYTYNVRDQLTTINQAGQTRSLAYDGHGRLQSRTTPEQGVTTYSYLANDRMQIITDARGATTTFAYNNRRLITGITYGVPAGVAATPNVTLGYDAAGNRTAMTDGLGSVSYGYDQLSRMSSETRTFSGVGSFALSYAYNLAGELTSITNPWSAQVGYGYDKTGRPTSVSGAGYAGVSSYVNSINYRAFGLKQMSYNNGRTLSVQYNNRLMPTQWNVPGVMGWNYAYQYFGENTGRVTYAQNINDPTLDRSYDYDNVGRLIEARTASEARGHLLGQSGTQDGPYAHSYRYDQTGNLWYRVGWGGWFDPWLEQWPNYANNRLTTNPWTGATMTYDAAGNLTNDGYQSYTYDATGQQTYASGTTLAQSYDGDGLRGKKVESGVSTYYLRSSVLGGQVISELNPSGGFQRGYVYLGSKMLAIQQNNQVSWVHQDPITKSQRITNSSGTVTSTIDLDPWGGETSRSSNQAFQPHRYTTYERDANGGDEAMMRRYAGKWHRFVQPDPYDGSYDLTNPQSFNRYAYVHNDPVNFVDPTGMFRCAGCPDDDETPDSEPGSTGGLGNTTGVIIVVPPIDEPGGGGGGAGPNPQDPPQDPPCTANAVNAEMGESGQGWYRYPTDDPGRLNFGQGGVVAALTNLGSDWNQLHSGNPIGIGDLGRRDGAPSPRHPQQGHPNGVVVDIRPMRNDGVSGPTNFLAASYSQELTRELVNNLIGLRDQFGNAVVTDIIFNDPGIEGTRRDREVIDPRTGRRQARVHDNHLHVTFRQNIGCP
jgi:RHS repeat-associated protein